MDCQRFIERIRIIIYLCRIMSNGINIIHPKASLKRLTRPDKIKYIIKESNNHVY
jgi:hypothetical protein